MTATKLPKKPGWRVIPPGGGKSTSAFDSTIRFALTGRDTHAQVAIGLASTPPGVSPPLHVHDGDDEMFIVVSGDMSFYTPDGWMDVVPGTVIYMERRTPHTFRNRGTTPSQHWVINVPSGFEEFFERCGPLCVGPHPPDIEKLRSIAEEYGYRILGPAPPG